MQHTNSKQVTLLLILFCISVFFVSLINVPVPTVDGVIRADEARDIVKTGVWFPIHTYGEVVTDHPPLYVWSQAVSFHIFGITDFAANLPERFFAALCLIVTFLITQVLTKNYLTAITSVIVLFSTRDFVLSSVRGYIESMLTFFSFFSFYLVILENKKLNFLSGISIFLAFFSKGPPALWPFLFIIFYLIVTKKFKVLGYYLLGFLISVIIFVAWNTSNNYWQYWDSYLQNQVLNSALKGRDGAQTLEPFYFAHIMLVYYWPWLPVLMASIIYAFYNYKNSLNQIFVILFGLGFFAGFSIVKWKFWYYIAPAYPAFAISCAIFIHKILAHKIEKFYSINKLIIANIIWIVIVIVFKVPLYYERVLPVHVFKNDILNSPPNKKVFLIHSFLDHNMIGSSGKWYFERPVYNVHDEEEKTWIEKNLNQEVWIITSQRHFQYCTSLQAPPHMRYWCNRSKIVNQSEDTILLTYTPN